jgi:hypothetical protein
LHRVLTVALLAAVASLLTACGSHHSNLADANNSGAYVKAGPVTYQLEVSRELNRYGSEDSGYLSGLPKREAALAPDQIWFGVFLWAKNTTHERQKTTANFDVVDTQGNTYKPIVYSNPYVWTSRSLAPGAIQPAPNTTAGFGPTQGQMLLFKVKTSAYSNRPLTLEIRGNTGKVWATISLDL